MTAADRRSAEGQAIDARLHQLEPAQVIATGGVQIVRPAAVPASAVPRLGLLQAAVALLLGLLLAAAVVAILERTDRRLVDDEALEAALGLPLLARVPRPARGVAWKIPSAWRPTTRLPRVCGSPRRDATRAS